MPADLISATRDQLAKYLIDLHDEVKNNEECMLKDMDKGRDPSQWRLNHDKALGEEIERVTEELIERKYGNGVL